MLAALRHATKTQAVYKLRGDIPAGGHEVDAVFRATVLAILNYCSGECLGRKPEEVFPAAALELKDFSIQDKTFTAECQALPEIHIWTLHFRFIQREKSNDQIDEFRNWYFDFGLMRTGRGLEFGWEAGTDVDSLGPPAFIPKLVPVLAGKTGLSQGRLLNGRHMIVKDIVDAENLYNLLSFSGRQLPVIVISEVNRRSWQYTPTPPMFLVDAANIAAKTAGYAHVVQLSFEGSYEWTQLAGQTWSVYDGAVRIFRPGFDVNRGLPVEHPIFFKDFIWEQHGIKEFSAYLMDYIRRAALAGFFNWDGMIFLPAAKIVKEAIARIKPDEDDSTLSEEYYEKKIARLTATIQREKRKNEKFAQENGILKEKNIHLEGMASSYERTINQMNGFKGNRPPEIKPEDIDIPPSFKGMSDWVELYLEKRLILHPRAVRSIDAARCKCPELVYKALRVLAFEYRDFRLGNSSERKFKGKCSELGLRHQNTVAKKRQATEDDLFFVNYPYHSSEKRLLEFALVKGNSRQPAFSVRIYFFWDEISQEVVVGHLPGQISNKITKGNREDQK